MDGQGSKEVKVIASITTRGGPEDGAEGEGGREPVVMALEKAELEALYDNLESIQQQLDALTEKQH